MKRITCREQPPIHTFLVMASVFSCCRFPLHVSGSRDVAFHIPLESKKKEVFRYKVRLPPYITCTQCVIQWTYYTGEHPT
jgi:hypothetical protein